jgi:hypothetical protein
LAAPASARVRTRASLDSTIALQFTNPLEEPHWDQALASREEAMIFHSAAWARVLHDTYGHRPIYHAVWEQDQIRALLPLMEVTSPWTGNRGVSLPFADECQPVGLSASEYRAVLEAFIAYGQKREWKYIECRGGRELAGNPPPSLSYYGHTLDLTPGEPALFARFEAAVRRAIRKAEREGVRVEIATTLHAAETYYGIHCQTRRKHGWPPQPWSFFSNIHRHLLSKGKGFVSLATFNGQPIAGAVFLLHGRKAFFKYGASVERFLPLRGNNLQMWEAMKWLCRHGVEELCFGRTARFHQGLRRFKLGWGTVETTVEYVRYDYPAGTYIRENNSDRHWYNWMFRHLPLRVSRLAGALLYPHAS